MFVSLLPIALWFHFTVFVHFCIALLLFNYRMYYRGAIRALEPGYSCYIICYNVHLWYCFFKQINLMKCARGCESVVDKDWPCHCIVLTINEHHCSKHQYFTVSVESPLSISVSEGFCLMAANAAKARAASHLTEVNCEFVEHIIAMPIMHYLFIWRDVRTIMHRKNTIKKKKVR